MKSTIPILTSLVAVAMVAACSKPAPEATPDEKYALYVQGEVRKSLKDPDSAKFAEVEAYLQAHVGCGKVNAKNAFGSYTGMEEFSYYDSRTHLLSENPKAYSVGSGRCLIASAEHRIAEVKAGPLPDTEKKKFIRMYEQNIADIQNDPNFKP